MSQPANDSPAPFTPGMRVKITQQTPRTQDNWSTTVQGTVQKFEQEKTGSWFAHSKDDKLWLDRLVIQKDDGEIVVCNLDQYTRVEVVS